jgi:Poxvirus A32 protein
MESLMPIPCLTLVSGPKASGKTHLISNLLYSLSKSKKIHHIKVMCPTALFNKSYPFIPPQHVIPKYNEVVIIEYLKEQENLVKQGIIREAVLVLDDCIGSTNFKSQLWEQLATTCRHPHLSIIIITQHIYRLPPCLRENADCAFILRTLADKNVEGLYKAIGEQFWANEKSFRDFIDENTHKFKCVYINTRKQTLKEAVTVFRPPPVIPSFQLKY